MTKGVIEEYGDEGRQVITEALENQALIDGPALVRQREPESDMRGIIGTWRTISQMWGNMESSLREPSATRAVIRITRCPLAEQWKKVDAPPEMCEIWDSYGITLLKAIHPDLKIRRLSTIYHGDPYCEEVWELVG